MAASNVAPAVRSFAGCASQAGRRSPPRPIDEAALQSLAGISRRLRNERERERAQRKSDTEREKERSLCSLTCGWRLPRSLEGRERDCWLLRFQSLCALIRTFYAIYAILYFDPPLETAVSCTVCLCLFERKRSLGWLAGCLPHEQKAVISTELFIAIACCCCCQLLVRPLDLFQNEQASERSYDIISQQAAVATAAFFRDEAFLKRAVRRLSLALLCVAVLYVRL